MDLMGIFWTIVLLAGNFFFVGAEFSLISARRSIIEPMAEAGNRAARLTLRGMENVSLMMAGAQLGITVCSLVLGFVTKPLVKTVLEGPLELAGVPPVWIDTISYAVAYALVTVLHVVLGEMVPKNIALAGPEKLALKLAPPLLLIVTVLRPFLWMMNSIANLILRAFGFTPKNEVTSAFTREEVSDMVKESHEEGLIDPEEADLLENALSFETRTAGQILIPLAEVSVLPVDSTPNEVEAAALERYSRFPVTDGASMLGYVHVKDTLAAEHRDRPLTQEMIRPLLEFKRDVSVLLVADKMRKSGTHLAVVRDGDAVAGIVALEDVLEELVGQITEA